MIKPGLSSAIFTAMDIVPTFMSIIGQSIPTQDVHGKDLSTTIFLQKNNQRDHLLYSPINPNLMDFMALRLGKFKAHFYTEGNSLSDDQNYDQNCSSTSRLTKHTPPILYDLEVDPGERYPLNTALFNDTLTRIYIMKKKLSSEILWAPSEIQKGQSKDAMPCCSKPSCQPFPKCCDCL